MMDYCRGPACGWLKEVDRYGLCADCRKMFVGVDRIIQEAFGPGLIDTTEEFRKVWDEVRRKRREVP
jgi:hypothetical protein